MLAFTQSSCPLPSCSNWTLSATTICLHLGHHGEPGAGRNRLIGITNRIPIIYALIPTPAKNAITFSHPEIDPITLSAHYGRRHSISLTLLISQPLGSSLSETASRHSEIQGIIVFVPPLLALVQSRSSSSLVLTSAVFHITHLEPLHRTEFCYFPLQDSNPANNYKTQPRSKEP